MASPNPDRFLSFVKPLIAEMRSVYGPAHPVFRSYILRPLTMVARLHQLCGQNEAAAKALEDCLSECKSPPLCYSNGPDYQIWLVAVYLSMGNWQKAKKVLV
jgi:hypothetical protein